jgi:hypothetical protein
MYVGCMYVCRMYVGRMYVRWVVRDNIPIVRKRSSIL